MAAVWRRHAREEKRKGVVGGGGHGLFGLVRASMEVHLCCGLLFYLVNVPLPGLEGSLLP